MNENCKTITIPTPIGGQMKPMLVLDTSNRSLIRGQQEAYVLSVLDSCEYSYSACGLADIICDKISSGKMESFPARYYPHGDSRPGTRDISQVLKRLEAKGKVISTLYYGLRFYCIVKEEK